MGSDSNSKPRRGNRGPRRRGASSGSKGGGPRSAAAAPRNPALELHPTTDVPDIETFTEWELGDDVQQAIADMGITTPTPIQRLSIGPVLKRRDIIAKAETGTGKTLAFGAGMMSKLDAGRATVLALVLCPTRELAQQVHDVLRELGKARGITTALIVGGDPPQPQVKALQDGAQLVVGTPGRVMDLYNQGFLSFPWTEFVVLDEADEMLEIGFIDDIKKILSYTPEERTTLLFSATFPPALLKLAREHTRDPLEIATAKGVSTVDHISQNYIAADDSDKWLALVRLIENSDPDDVFLVFGDRRTDVDQLMRRFERMPFNTKALHGGYDQAARFRVMSAFRTGDVKALVATDVASRGLDVKHVTHVVNYGVPRDVSIYTHRIGRTGRAGAKGAAITLVSPRDKRRWSELTRAMNWDVDEMPIPERAGRGRKRDDRPKRRERGEREEREGRPKRRREEREERPERGERKRSERPRRRDREERDDDKLRPVETPGRGKRVRISKRRQQAEAQAGGAPSQAEDKPRREERKPRRERTERSERPKRSGRNDKPERKERKPAAKHVEAPAPGGFGAGLSEPQSEPKPKPKPRREKPAPKETPKPPTPPADSFGAGI